MNFFRKFASPDKTRQSAPPNGIFRVVLTGLIIFLIVFCLFAILAVALAVVVREQRMRSVMDDIERNQSGNQLTDAFDLLKKLSTGGLPPLNASASAPLIDAGSSPQNAAAKSPQRILAERSGRPDFGNPDAKLEIVEFADFECPFCQEEHSIIREVMNKHSDDIYFIYRQFPVKTEFSLTLSHVSLCAAEQGKFWTIHDRLYANQGKINQPQDLDNLVLMSGIKPAEFTACLNEEKYNSMIIEDMDDAKNLDVQGTPTFFVNGNKVEGTLSAADWEKIISKYKELSQ